MPAREPRPAPAHARGRAVPVRVGASDGSFTQIVGPLKAGDEVIVGGGPKARIQPRGGPMGGGVRVRM